MTQRQAITRLTTSSSAAVARRFAYDRRQLVAARFISAGTLLAHQSSKMQQFRSRSDSSRQDKECPLCQQFGRSPCRDAFYAWYDCTEEAAGSGRSEDEITEDCAKQFDAFRECLDHQMSTSILDEEERSNDINTGDLTQLRDTWNKIIYSDLASARRDSFPLGKHPMITKSSDGWLVSFSQGDLVLVFVQRVMPNGEKEVVVAAAAGDLMEDTVRIPSDRLGLGDTMILSAVYETPSSDGGTEAVVYEERIECSDASL